MVKKGITERDAFILEKAKGYSPSEIIVLLEREGFKTISEARVYQILENHGIKPKSKRDLISHKKGASTGSKTGK